MEDEQQQQQKQGEDGPPLKKRQRGGYDDHDDDDAGDGDGERKTSTGRGVAHTMVPYNNQDDDDDDEENTHRHMNHNDNNRTTSSSSSLPSPTLSLTGHSGSVYALEYSPDHNGTALLSASFDKTVLLWSHPDYKNYNVLCGHKNAVLDAHWVDADTAVTCSADQTVMLWDALTGTRLRKFIGHAGIVNACCKLHNANSVECNVVASVSDDGTCRLWDRRQKPGIATLHGGDGDGCNSSNLPILAVAGTDEQLFTAGIDNRITCWDWKMMPSRKLYAMTGHTDTITSLALHPSVTTSGSSGGGGGGGELTFLLSNGMDHTLKMWDVRPFVVDQGKRFVKQFVGHKHNAEKGLLKCAWSSHHSSSSSCTNNIMVTAGSADRLVHIWDEYSTDELYLLPGHKGCVHAVTFHPVEPNVVASGSSDNTIFVGELSS